MVIPLLNGKGKISLAVSMCVALRLEELLVCVCVFVCVFGGRGCMQQSIPGLISVLNACLLADTDLWLSAKCHMQIHVPGD